MLRHSTVLAVFAALLMGAAGPVFAEAPGTPPPAAAATQVDALAVALDLNARRSKLYHQADLAGATALYTEEADYIELLPILQRFKGRAEIKAHLQQLLSVDAVDIAPAVVEATVGSDGTIRTSGDYIIRFAEKAEIGGHFMQILRNDNGVWRIALHVFARSAPITQSEYTRD
jgi:hypothetical protein